jgi:hypothetical protein
VPLSSPPWRYDPQGETFGCEDREPFSSASPPPGVGRGIGRTKTHPKIIGNDVPMAKTRRKSEVFPGNTACAIVENKKADSPKPDNTNAVMLVLYGG